MARDVESPIRLHRRFPRHRVLLWAGVGLAGLLAIGGVLTAVFWPQIQHQVDVQRSQVSGKDGIDDLAAAQEAYRDAHGSYAPGYIELTEEHDLPGGIVYRIQASPDGGSYIAGAVAVKDGYIAFVGEDGEATEGQGDTWAAALEDAGWTPAWHEAEGFAPFAEFHRVVGGLGVHDGSLFFLSNRPAGAEQPGFDIYKLTPADTAGAGVFGPVATDASPVGSGASAAEAVEAAGLPDDLFATEGNAITCAARTDPEGDEYAAACQSTSGHAVLFTSGGHLFEREDGFQPLLAEVGMEWFEDHDVTAPTWEDLF